MDMTTSREGRRDGDEGVAVPTAEAARSVEMLHRGIVGTHRGTGVTAEQNISEPCRHTWRASGIAGEMGH